MDNEHSPAPRMDLSMPPDHGSTPGEPRPKSSPAALWIAGLLTFVVVVVIIGAIASSRQAAEDCRDDWNSYALSAPDDMDWNDPEDIRRHADRLRASAEGLRDC